MVTDTLLNSLKSLFSSLGAKTSDSNYAVGLFDKTSGEPKGLMDMSNLASVLGEQFIDLNTSLDLNTVKTASKYNIGSSYVSGVSNLPSEVYQVSRAALATETIPFGNYIVQRVYIVNDGTTFQRTCMNNDWKPWVKVQLTS